MFSDRERIPSERFCDLTRRSNLTKRLLRQSIFFMLALFLFPSCGSLGGHHPRAFSKDEFVRRNASRLDLIQWVIFKPYWLNGKRVSSYSSGHQGFRFEPPEGSVLWSEWDNKEHFKEKRLVEKVVIGRGSGFHDIPYVVLNKRYLEEMVRSWKIRNPGKPEEEILFGLLVGKYLVNFRSFAMEYLSQKYWGLRLPFHSSEPYYSLEQLKSLFPNAKVTRRKE